MFWGDRLIKKQRRQPNKTRTNKDHKKEWVFNTPIHFLKGLQVP